MKENEKATDVRTSQWQVAVTHEAIMEPLMPPAQESEVSKKKTSSSFDWSLWIKSLGFGVHYNPWTALTHRVMVVDLEIIALMKILTLSRKIQCSVPSIAALAAPESPTYLLLLLLLMLPACQMKSHKKNCDWSMWFTWGDYPTIHCFTPITRQTSLWNDKQLDQFMRSFPSSSYNSCIG